jgi:hypothetical protein
MPSRPDLIERLWCEVINLNPAGKWMEPTGNETSRYRETILKVRSNIAAEDLARFARFIRYESCFTVISTLEDRSIPKIGLDAVITELRALPKNRKAPRSVANYFSTLDLNLHPENEDSDWIPDLAKDAQKDSPFGDTGPTIERLLSSGATKSDLGEIAAWQNYVAVLKTHEFIQQSGHNQFEGLREVFLSSDPSGLEGRPGSWPVKSPSKSTSRIEPLWKTRSGQAVAFSPDSQRIAIAGASGPARIFDTNSGKELVVCDCVKAHIDSTDFSPDGKRLAITEMYDRCDVCDATTGQLIKKHAFPRRPSDCWQISGLAYGPSGDLIRSAWQNLIDIVDANTFQRLEPLRPAASTRSVDAIAITPDRRKLAAVWHSANHKQHAVTMWSWPEREALMRFPIRLGKPLRHRPLTERRTYRRHVLPICPA